jgi:uncharacterized phage infection (PIP) family protein YhgE
LFALWLDRHLLSHLRGISRVLRDGDVHALRGLPSTTGWGELSDLTADVSQRLSRERQLESLAAETESLRVSLVAARERIERWSRTEVWEPLKGHPNVSEDLAQTLDRAFERDSEARDQNLDAARQIESAILETHGDARESVEQAERGFVESTALLTTVRELQRLATELQSALEAPAVAPASGAAGIRELAASALEQLIEASAASVEYLASGLARVREVTDQVHVVANRATLVALQAAGADPGISNAERLDELRRLTQDVRSASDGAETIAREVERAAQAANSRMSEARASVAMKLDALPATASPVAAGEESIRLLERVREMVQDATRKGERLSAAGERSSRAAERLARRLDEQASEMEGLVVRLSRAGSATHGEPARPEDAAPGASPGLRLLDRDESEADAPREQRDPGDSRREERP